MQRQVTISLSLRVLSIGEERILEISPEASLRYLYEHIQITYGRTTKVGLYWKTRKLQGFAQCSIGTLLKTFPSAYIIHGGLDFKEQQLRDNLTKKNPDKIAIVVQYLLGSIPMSEKFVIELKSQVALLIALSNRRKPNCAIDYNGLYLPLNRFPKGQQVSTLRRFVQSDGFLHIMSSDFTKFELQEQVIPHNEMQQALIKQTQRYKWVELKSLNRNSGGYVFIQHPETDPVIFAQIVNQLSSESLYFPNTELTIIEDPQLLRQCWKRDRIVFQARSLNKFIFPTQLKYTVAVAYREPLLYLVSKGNIFIVIDVINGYTVTYRKLHLKQALAAYQQYIPVVLENRLLMYEILKSGVRMFWYTLQGKLLNEQVYPWNQSYQYEFASLDFVCVKLKPQQDIHHIWKVYDPEDSLTVQGEEKSKIFMSRGALGMYTLNDLILIYYPSNLRVVVYNFSSKKLMYMFECRNYLQNIAINKAGTKVAYYNSYSAVYELELESGKKKEYARKMRTGTYFYNKKDELLGVSNDVLYGSQGNEIRNVTSQLLISGDTLYTVSQSDNISMIIFE